MTKLPPSNHSQTYGAGNKLSAARDYCGDPVSLTGRSILVTGGTGSFGRRFVDTVLGAAKPSRLVVFSRDELKQYEMEQDLRELGLPLDTVRFFLGDVRDVERLEMAMKGIDTVIHAAALKQVPAAEYNPFECIHTNVLGAENVVRAAIRTGVKKVLALSTDKACSPINLYGASKLAADKIFIAANNLSGIKGCKFSIVRYGNVMGSRGSVVPFFRRLAEQGAKELPITSARMTRFWISLDQGVSFVISCVEKMSGGELFVPKIPSLKVTDLALAIAPQLPHKIVGTRPGEKVHEFLITEDDARNTVELGDRYVIAPQTFLESYAGRYDQYGHNRVREDFQYSSDTNEEWLSVEDIRAWLT